MSVYETLPNLEIEVNGAALETSVARSLSSVYVAQGLSLPALCELTFVTSVASPPASFDVSATLRVVVAADEPLFDGAITGVSHRYGPANAHEIRVRGYDPLHRLRQRRPVRAHVERTLGELAGDLVADLGLSVEIDDGGPAWRRLMQWRQSDLELLAEAASRRGLYFRARGGALEFVTLEGAGEPVALDAGGSLLEAYFDASADRACRRVSIRGWNPWDATEQAAVVDRARSGRRVDRSGGDGVERTLVDEVMQSDADAAPLAQAELDWHVAGEVVVHGIAEGDPRLLPGARIEVGGIDSGFEGQYVLTEVVHRLDRKQGFRSEFDTAPPPQPERARGALTTLGIVIDVGDPDSFGRARVRLPNYCDVETDWLAVVAAGAGSGKGWASLPDVGDRVLLIVPRGDLSQALILGGLYGNEAPLDAGVRGGRVQSYTLVLPGGQRLTLDGEHKRARLENGSGNNLQLAPGKARIENSDGSFVELTRDRVRVHANADLELEAPGKTVVIRGARVDFQTG